MKRHFIPLLLAVFCLASEAQSGMREVPLGRGDAVMPVERGADPEGDPCEARHWHGFIRHEPEAVKMITDWIKNPQS